MSNVSFGKPEISESGPGVTFKNSRVGAYIDLGIVNVEEVQQTDYDTGEPLWWGTDRRPTTHQDNNARPVTHHAVTGIVLAAVDCEATPDYRPIQVGEVLTLWTGHRDRIFKTAWADHGELKAGDLMRWAFTETEPAQNSRHNDKKIFTCQIASPQPADGDVVDRCVAAYREMQERPAVAAPAPGPFDQPAAQAQPAPQPAAQPQAASQAAPQAEPAGGFAPPAQPAPQPQAAPQPAPQAIPDPF